jgi:hypothetical protein
MFRSSLLAGVLIFASHSAGVLAPFPNRVLAQAPERAPDAAASPDPAATSDPKGSYAPTPNSGGGATAVSRDQAIADYWAKRSAFFRHQRQMIEETAYTLRSTPMRPTVPANPFTQSHYPRRRTIYIPVLVVRPDDDRVGFDRFGW